MEHNFTNQVNASNANGGLKKINLSQSLKRPHFCLFLFTLIHLLDKSCLTSSNQQWQEKLPCKRRKPGAGPWPADGRLASLICIWQHLYEERHFWYRLNLEWSGLQMRMAEFGAERAANPISSSVLIRLDVGCCILCGFFLDCDPQWHRKATQLDLYEDENIILAAAAPLFAAPTHSTN